MNTSSVDALGGLRNISILFRYWIKGRLSKVVLIWLALGDAFAFIFIGVGTQSLLAFSTKFGLGATAGGVSPGGLSGSALGLVFAFILVGLLQSGFSGSGLPITSADVDYVMTSPVKPRDIFAAKILVNSLTTVLLSFPPMLFLYIRLSSSYGTSLSAAPLAGLTTLAFLVMGLVISADVTVSLRTNAGKRQKVIRNALVAAVAIIGILPITLLIPGIPPVLSSVSQVLPSGLAADISASLVSGTHWSLSLTLDVVLLLVWFVGSVLVGIRMSRNNFYEVLQVVDSTETREVAGSGATTVLATAGRSIWSVVREKENIIMKRSGQRRGLLISTLFLSGFIVIYSLAGTFQSSPTSFLFILFLIGSFGSGNASGWLEKERLWIIKTSALDVTRYVREVFRARVTPMLLVLTPIVVIVGIPLIINGLDHLGSLLGVALALPVALEVAAVMMGGGMYFASKYGQSAADDILSTQAQQLTDVKRFLYQTVMNLALVSPLMGLVLAATQASALGVVPVVSLAAVLSASSVAYTYGILSRLFVAAGNSIIKREDL
jgi:hypothetical protein